MGEFAKLKTEPEGESFKIGTCENMYYLRYEDIDKIIYDYDFNMFNFRVPFIDEDNIKVGNYIDPFRGLPLSDYSNPVLAKKGGLIQITHKSGLLLNTACYHGEKLPESCGQAQFHWNGKTSKNYELKFLKLVNGKIYPVIGCRWCGVKWRMDWVDIWEKLPKEYQERFEKYK